MEKPKKINWKDTNVALIGSELDHKVKKAAAEGEPQWKGIGQQVELRIWRIEQFRVVPWPKTKYGKFHEGDSYIVLNTYKEYPAKPKFSHDVHMWIGNESSQDEYGTAAYKMVECDEILDGAAIQHREVQGQESSKFLSYFKGRMTILKGGVETGFHHVETASKAEPHLYRIKGKENHIQIKQLAVRRDEMNLGDVFILDVGNKIFQWNGGEANTAEKMKGGEVLRDMASRGVKSVVLDHGINDDEASGEGKEFWKYLPGETSFLGVFAKKLELGNSTSAGDDAQVREFVPVLYSLGASIRKVASAKNVPVGPAKGKNLRIKRKFLDSSKVMLLDEGFHIYVWQGKASASAQKVAAVHQVQQYLASYKRPVGLPVSFLKEGQGARVGKFSNVFYDAPPGCFDCLWCP